MDHLIKTGEPVNDIRIDNARGELWDQWEGIQSYIPFVFPDGPRDCFILAVTAGRHAEVLRGTDQNDASYKEAEALLQRALERLATGLLNYVEEKAIDEELRKFLVHHVDRNKGAVAACHEITAKQLEAEGAFEPKSKAQAVNEEATNGQ